MSGMSWHGQHAVILGSTRCGQRLGDWMRRVSAMPQLRGAPWISVYSVTFTRTSKRAT